MHDSRRRPRYECLATAVAQVECSRVAFVERFKRRCDENLLGSCTLISAASSREIEQGFVSQDSPWPSSSALLCFLCLAVALRETTDDQSDAVTALQLILRRSTVFHLEQLLEFTHWNPAYHHHAADLHSLTSTSRARPSLFGHTRRRHAQSRPLRARSSSCCAPPSTASIERTRTDEHLAEAGRGSPKATYILPKRQR